MLRNQFWNQLRNQFNQIWKEYNATKWRLIINDSSKSLKATLLNNGKELAFIPVAYSVEMNETYDNIANFAIWNSIELFVMI